MWGFKKEKTLEMKKLLPLVMKLGHFLKDGFDHYIDYRSVDNSLSQEDLTLFIYNKMESWNPVIKGKSVLDADTKKAAARFVAGLAINLAQE
jgi:hypothetical protein